MFVQKADYQKICHAFARDSMKSLDYNLLSAKHLSITYLYLLDWDYNFKYVSYTTTVLEVYRMVLFKIRTT